MKRNVLDASPKLADSISKTLLSPNADTGKSKFKRRKIDFGFEIYGYRQGKEETVFRYTDINGRRMMEYNEHLLKIG